MINTDLREGFQRKLIDYLFKVKVIISLILISFLIFFHYFQFLDLNTTPIILVFLFELIIFFSFLPLRARKPEWVIPYNILSLYCDVLAVTFVLHYFGGIYSMIWAVDYLLLIAISSVFLSKRGRISYAVYTCIVYTFFCYLEHQGIVARHNIFHIPVSGKLDLFCWLSTMLLLAVTALISNNFIEMFSRVQRFADLGRLSTELAHEIRTPLQIIEGTTYLTGFPEEGRSEIRSQVERITRFVKEILALGREERQKLSKARIQDIMEYSINLIFKFSPTQKRIEIEKRFSEEELWVNVDIDQVTKALSNLVRNGIDSIQEEGMLSVHVSRYGFEWVQVEVHDTGVGIHQNEFSRIFEPFYTTKTGMRGVGLGLAIAKKFVEANGGVIDVDSVVGKGSRFTVRLPLFSES